MKISTKIVILLASMFSTTLLLSSSISEDSPRCEKKIQNIQEQIKIAKGMNNTHRIDGLEISLSKVKAHCSDEDLIQDIKDKIKDTKEDLNEHTKDYKEALRDNRTDKMQKYQSKLDEDNAEIKKLQKELEN